MKFLCPNCKAKYRVDDEKVAGRSLRMKCRRCAFLIALSEAPPAPVTLAPSDGELLPRLPGPPAIPDLPEAASAAADELPEASSQRPPPSIDHTAQDLAAAGLARPRLPFTAWIALAVALLLGVTIGFVLFADQTQPAPAAAAPTAAPAAETTSLAEHPAPPIPDVAPSLVASNLAPAPPTPLRGGIAAAAKRASKPQAEPDSPTVSGAAPVAPAKGGPLDSATIESTVARYRGNVKHSCWQPALEARGDGVPTSARVSVSFTIAPSGAVQNVTTSADPPGYAGLGSCIAARVRGWQFPAAAEPTPVNVPFVFAGQ